MRIGLTTRNPVVAALSAMGILPTPLIVAFWGMESSRALIAAVELGIFDALAERPKSAEEVARELSYDDVGVEALLNALNGFGYLRRRKGRFSNRRAVRRWLTSDARFTMARPFGLFRVLWDEMGDMEDRVRSGGHRDFHRPERDTEFWRRYEVGLGEFARLTAPAIARSVRLDRPPTRLLDVGGGHGAYSAAFCRRYPGLRTDVLDLAPAAAVGRDLVAAQDMGDRITFREGDLVSAEWGEGYDVVLIFNVLHVLSPADARAAVAKAHAALAPGGTLAIVDSAHRGAKGDLDAVGGGSELLFYVINGTRAYPEETMLGWVRDAGFISIRSRRLLAMPEVLITARRGE